MHPEFVDVLAQRIAEYSGRDVNEVRSAVSYAGARLPVRMADFVLDELRVHVEDEDEPQMVAEYKDARRRLITRLGDEIGTVSKGAGTEVQQQQQARADAERVFARVVDVVDPVELSCGVPRAGAQQRSARIAAGRAALRALPASRVPEPETVGDWLDAGQQLDSARGDSLAQAANRQRLVSRMDLALRRAAGDGMYDPRTGAREPDPTLRDGIAVAWALKAQRELGANTGVRALAVSDGSLPDRFEGPTLNQLSVECSRSALFAAVGECGRSAT